jgi:lantibiotic biosynthesis protein
MNKETTQNDLVASGFFAFRTPLLPFDELVAWGDGLQATSALHDPARLEMAFAADRGRLCDRLRTLFARTEVREALFVASPGLEEQLDRWSRDAESETGRKIERSLARYFLRMAGRATPFGLFAGCSVGEMGDTTRLIVAERAR